MDGAPVAAPAAPAAASAAAARPPVVPEAARFCRECGGPVGRARDGRPAREQGTCPWCGARFDLRPALRPGDVAAGTVRGDRYVVERPLLFGARGWLYTARDGAGELVVLTRLEGPEGRAAGDLAVDEPEVLLGLAHPGLVPARDVATVDEPAGPARVLVLGHVEGVGVDVLRRGGPLPPAHALDLVAAALPAVGYLHDRGLLHSDLSPANLRRAPTGVVVMDLGGVRRLADRTSDLWGAAGFLAPEIAPGGTGPSVASDVYALGRTLAVLTLECRALDGRGFDHTRNHALRLPDPAATPVLREHPTLATLLARTTDPDPGARPRDVAALDDAIRGVRATLPGDGASDRDHGRMGDDGGY